MGNWTKGFINSDYRITHGDAQVRLVVELEFRRTGEIHIWLGVAP